MFSMDKSSNIILCNLSNDELEKLLKRINTEPLRFRSKLNLPDYVSFGNEIEINSISMDKASLLVELFNDVKELYNTKGYISNKGDIMCGEFVENSSNAEITNKGIFEGKEFEDTMYVPQEYEMVEYIQSTGTQYIDSGISLGTNMVFETVVSDVVEGAYIITQGNYGLRYNWSTFVNFVSGRRFRGTITAKAGVVNLVKGSNDFISVDGVNGNQESDNDTPSGNVMICKSGGCKMYKCILYNGDTLVRYYIPVRRRTDSVLGLYDCVNNKFYVNAGSGTFNAGNTLNNFNALIYQNKNVLARNIIEI